MHIAKPEHPSIAALPMWKMGEEVGGVNPQQTLSLLSPETKTIDIAN